MKESTMTNQFNITSSAIVTSSDRKEAINDVKATNYADSNTIKASSSLYTSLQTIKHTTKNKPVTAYCSVSGIEIEVSLPSNNLIANSTNLYNTFSLNAKILLSSALALSDKELYSLNSNLLAGITLTALYSINLFVSPNASKAMDNAILQTATKYTLVELIKVYRLIASNRVDLETLPKLSLSYETHNSGITNFNKPLEEYTTVLEASLKGGIKLYSKRDEEKARRDELLEIIRLEKQAATKNARIESEVTVRWKSATKAIKKVAIDLNFLGYTKLLQVMNNLTATQLSGTIASKEVKDKVILRLNEIITKYDSPENKDLRIHLNTLLSYFTLLSTPTSVAINTAHLERVSDVSSNATINQSSSVKETLLERLNRAKKGSL